MLILTYEQGRNVFLNYGDKSDAHENINCVSIEMSEPFDNIVSIIRTFKQQCKFMILSINY